MTAIWMAGLYRRNRTTEDSESAKRDTRVCVFMADSTGLGFQASRSVNWLFAWMQNPQLLPIVSKLFSAIEAHNTNNSVAGSRWQAVVSSNTDWETHSCVATSKQSIENRHLLLHLLYELA